jgi:hypothetical protein
VQQPDPWGPFRRVGIGVRVGQARTVEGLTFSRFLASNGFVQFRNYWELEAGHEQSFEVLDDLDTRGGPPIVRPASTAMYAGVGSDSRRTWRFVANTGVRRDEAGGWNARFGSDFSMQPSGRVQAAVSATYTAGTDAAQWIANTDTNGDGHIDYVYGTLDRDVIDVTLRSTYAVHRDLTIQIFLQPFVAAGEYRDIRRLAAPRSFLFEPATLDASPDFNRKSLRGNVVLRWEYVRGSTLFVAWNLAASDLSRPGTFSALRDLGDAFGAEGTHAVMVKISYRLSR